MRAFLALLLTGFVLAGLFIAKDLVGMWPVPLFYAGLFAAVYLTAYDLMTDGEIKNGILIVPFTLLAAAVVAKFVGI
jgi:hypothetical protein